MVEVKVSKGHGVASCPSEKLDIWPKRCASRDKNNFPTSLLCLHLGGSTSEARQATLQPSAGLLNVHDHFLRMAAPMDERISVPIDDPNADTEWYCPTSRMF